MRFRTALLAFALGLLAFFQAAPSDPYYPQQWGLQRIGAPDAWQVTRGQGVVVAVIDTGVALGHPDLSGAFDRGADGRVRGIDLVDNDDDPTDEHGHGTMVAGIVAARTSNGTGVASVAPQAKLLPIRVLDAQAQGTAEDVDEGIRWAVDNGADVINLSLEAARERREEPLPPLDRRSPDDAVRYAWDRGVVVVAAAGNDSSEFTDYPDDSPVLLVGASTRDDSRAGFSDTGRRDSVIAPGVDIVSTWCSPCGEDASYAVGQSEGTSYAAPHVAGAVALLRGAGLNHREAVQRLRETAKDVGPPGRDDSTGYGRIDAAAAVGVTASPSPSPSERRTPEPSPEPTRTRTAAGTDDPNSPRPTPEPPTTGQPTTPSRDTPESPASTTEPQQPSSTDVPARDRPSPPPSGDLAGASGNGSGRVLLTSLAVVFVAGAAIAAVRIARRQP